MDLFPRLSDARRLAAVRSATAVRHPAFGDLSRPGAVRLASGRRRREAGYREADPLFIHLGVTGRCYARCKGCINAAVTHNSKEPRHRLTTQPDMEPERDGAAVVRLAGLHPEMAVTVCFYGGEPLLVPERIARTAGILDASPIGGRVRYLLYTSGELIAAALERYPELMRRLWLYSVSIDGRTRQHDSVRSGTRLERIHRSLERLAEVRTGPVLQWSTLREEQSLLDCFREFLYLEGRGLASHFFWHWVETDEPYRDFPAYLARYERDLKRVLDVCLDRLAAGRPLKIIHLDELLLYLFTGRRRGTTACGVEAAGNYDLGGGRVFACADLPPELAIGSVAADGSVELREAELARLAGYKERLGCPECGVEAYCGGRCPVEALTGTPERLFQYCQLMRLHVGLVSARREEFRRLLKRRRISLQALYDRSAFMAAYTDVVP
ncbi:MAG TPA: hypothetical protein PKN80_04110 [bacterium]|nr:hypothetical protein [bacterium]